MAYFHPSINIDIDKSFCIRKYENKGAEFVTDKVRELSEDCTNWSGAVIKAIDDIITNEHLTRLQTNYFIPLFTSAKTLNISLEKSIDSYNKDELIEKMRIALDNANNEETKPTSINEVYIALDNSIIESFDDISMGHLVMLLSKLSTMKEKLWLSITFTIKEIKGAIFHFTGDRGLIRLSDRSFPSYHKEDIMKMYPIVSPYIDAMNSIITEERALPRQ